MPDNTERDIERRLREAAAERRAAAGDPTLHPANRRMLQAEVRRRWGALSGTGATHWLKHFWPRIGVAAALLALLALVSWKWLLPPAPESQFLAKLNAIPEMASTNSVMATSAVAPELLAAPAAVPGSDIAASPSDSRARRVAESISRGPVAPATRAVEERTDKLMTVGAGGGRMKELPTHTTRDERELFALAGSVNQPKGESSRSQTASAPSVANVQAFRNVAGPAEDKLKASKPTVVLNYFTVSRNGDQFTVVDADGSVYLGNVTPVAAEAEVGAKALGLNQATRPAVADQSAVNKDIQSQQLVGAAAKASDDGWALNNASGAVQNWAFKVEGTNRSLRQKVVFTGNLLQNGNLNSAVTFANQANSNYYLNRQVVNTGELNRAEQNQAPIQNNFINGRVILGKQQEAEVNALAVEPQ
jgi:hypothetical protein